MSWDIVIFHLNRKVNTVEEIDESVLESVSGKTLKAAINTHFNHINWNGDLARVADQDYELEFSVDETDTYSNAIFSVYGEYGVYALLDFCKKNGWQAFDTALGEMLDSEHPENNGYQNFQDYLAYVLKSRGSN